MQRYLHRNAYDCMTSAFQPCFLSPTAVEQQFTVGHLGFINQHSKSVCDSAQIRNEWLREMLVNISESLRIVLARTNFLQLFPMINKSGNAFCI